MASPQSFEEELWSAVRTATAQDFRQDPQFCRHGQIKPLGIARTHRALGAEVHFVDAGLSIPGVFPLREEESLLCDRHPRSGPNEKTP